MIGFLLGMLTMYILLGLGFILIARRYKLVVDNSVNGLQRFLGHFFVSLLWPIIFLGYIHDEAMDSW
jgi:hypothetical protein